MRIPDQMAPRLQIRSTESGAVHAAVGPRAECRECFDRREQACVVDACGGAQCIVREVMGTGAHHDGAPDVCAALSVLAAGALKLRLRSNHGLRNCWRRGVRELPKSCEGGPDSTICPASMNTTLSEIFAAKLISCVTMTIVMPSWASERITFSTSSTSSGSSDEVGSSSRITSG